MSESKTAPTRAEMRQWITEIVLKAYPNGLPMPDNDMSISIVKALIEHPTKCSAPNDWEWKPISAHINETDEGKWFYKIIWQKETSSMATVNTSNEASDAVTRALLSRTT